MGEQIAQLIATIVIWLSIQPLSIQYIIGSALLVAIVEWYCIKRHFDKQMIA